MVEVVRSRSRRGEQWLRLGGSEIGSIREPPAAQQQQLVDIISKPRHEWPFSLRALYTTLSWRGTRIFSRPTLRRRRRSVAHFSAWGSDWDFMGLLRVSLAAGRAWAEESRNIGAFPTGATSMSLRAAIKGCCLWLAELYLARHSRRGSLHVRRDWTEGRK